MAKICIWWDSTGRWAFDKDQWGWANRLHIRGLKNHLYVYNFSVSSNDTRGVLYAMEKQISIINKIEPEEEYIYIFAIWSNDARYKSQKSNKITPLPEFKSNLEKIIKSAKDVTNKIMFVGLKKIDESKTRPIPWETTEYYENDDLQRYNQTLIDICNENNVNFLSMWDTLNNEDFEDWLHPNSQWHEKIYKKVKEHLNNNLID